MAEVNKILESVPDPDRRRSWRNAFEQKTPPEVIEESHRRTREGVMKIERALQQRPWLAGSSYSLADIDFMNFCGTLLTLWMGDIANEESAPAFMDWTRRMGERTAVKEMNARRTGMPTLQQMTEQAGKEDG
jgi:glutathione S-transferase